jgi:hypothetical protein
MPAPATHRGAARERQRHRGDRHHPPVTGGQVLQRRFDRVRLAGAGHTNGCLLSWNAEALGPDPAQRLTGDLTTRVAGALHSLARTDIAAATALSLHLNHAPQHFCPFRVKAAPIECAELCIEE